MPKSVVSLWFPTLASDRVLRARPVDGPFALTLHQKNTDRLYCLNTQAQKIGLYRGMGFSDAKTLCPDLQSHPADIMADMRFQRSLARWATRYCPWVGLDGQDGLVMDASGSTHLFGSAASMLEDMRVRLSRAKLATRIGLAETRGAAWALAHYAEGIAEPDELAGKIAPLPVSALRLDEKTCVTLQRLGIRTIGDLTALPRATLTRRFGAEVVLRLDQALGQQSESISPLSEKVHYSVRLTLPEPIGLLADVMACTARLLPQLCHKLNRNEKGARVLLLTLRRVDQASQQVELRLARALRDPDRILPLFERVVKEIDSGFGIEQLRLEATRVEDLPIQQVSHTGHQHPEALDDLVTRLGTRIGLENIIRFLPAESHIPERSFIVAPAAYCEPSGPWVPPRSRPLRLFPPESIRAEGRNPPRHFIWRRMTMTTAEATGPERIAPEWWLEDDKWRSGVRDYWRISTKQGRRLWLFYTPQKPGWFVQGEFA